MKYFECALLMSNDKYDPFDKKAITEKFFREDLSEFLRFEGNLALKLKSRNLGALRCIGLRFPPSHAATFETGYIL